MNLIETIKNLCHECYACVRKCPIKAVRVWNGQAEVISERCINCGNCVRVCSQGAKKVKDYLGDVKEFLEGPEKVVVGLAPSFPSFFPQATFHDWQKYLLSLGFDTIYEVSWGAQLIIEDYKRLLEKEKDKVIISSACPVVVNLIEKYYPNLVENLAEIASPMDAFYRYILKKEEPETKLVLIGPCLTKKQEMAYAKNVVVLTFSEILELGEELTNATFDSIIASDQVFSCHDDKDKSSSATDFEIYPKASARRLPLAGGLLNAVDSNDNPREYIRVEGEEKIFELLNCLENGEINPQFIDVLFCDGCINGVDLRHINYFKKENAVNHFIEELGTELIDQKLYSSEIAADLDLTKRFKADFKELPQPTEEEIWKILNQTNKYKDDDLLNCGACGYSSCEEKAIAVYQGLAEVEMCLSYLLSEKRKEIKEIQELNEEMDNLINSSFDGMMMVNQNGVVIRVNDAYVKIVGCPRNKLIGRHVDDLERDRVVYPAVSKLGLREKRRITIVQNTKSGKSILVTASPIFDKDNSVIRVVINARDICEISELETKTEESKKICKYLSNRNLRRYRDDVPANIIYNSVDMQNILKLAKKIGRTTSSVLVTGESGVGKEVIARYIHELSGRKNDFIKINCGAIPETLLESELFGYETGAFSGARRDGKPGLIEMADGGTLFLDEIGEMPLNLQVKLLQVLQERRVIRLGGVERIDVDFRLITATNREIKEMVANKTFREDLYYRLNVVPIVIPALRNRREDILPIVNYYLNQINHKYNKDIDFTVEAKHLLIKYDWPGNVRELSNLLERIIVTTEETLIDEESLLKYMEVVKSNGSLISVAEIMPLEDAIIEVEKKLLLMVKEKGNSTYQMAKMLGVNQSTIVRKMKKYFN